MSALKKVSVLLIAVCIILSFSSCDQGFLKPCFKGEGDITTEVLELSTFDRIELGGSINVTISQGATQEVKAIGHSNIINRLKTNVSNNTWNIDLKNGCYKDYELKIEITIPNIKAVKISGSGDVMIHDFTDQNSLENKISGSGKIILNKFEGLSNLETRISGSGSFKANQDISGVESVDIDISGSGEFYAYNISSKNADAKISGSGRCELTVTNNLNAKISGSGKVFYKGTPSISQNISGTGSLINAN